LRHLRREVDVLIWSEADHREVVDGRDRVQLAPAPVLAVWTAPPGPAELAAALDAVAPERVYLFGLDPGYGTPQEFLSRLLGLVKRALRVDEGAVTVPALAAATAQRAETVRAGLAWLAARGRVAIIDEGAEDMRLVAGDGAPTGETAELEAQLAALLKETRAYRAYFSRAPVEALV
jgi:hypothetical protein